MTLDAPEVNTTFAWHFGTFQLKRLDVLRINHDLVAVTHKETVAGLDDSRTLSRVPDGNYHSRSKLMTRSSPSTPRLVNIEKRLCHQAWLPDGYSQIF